MKTHQRTLQASKPKTVPASHTTLRQQRQHHAGSAVTIQKLNAREFKRLKDMVLWLQERKSYRWLEKYTGRGHGWWQQVGAGKRNRVAPNHADLTNIQRLYDILRSDEEIDAQALNLLLEIVEARGIMDMALAKLINMVRKNPEQA